MGKQINFLMDLHTENLFKEIILQEGEILFEGANSEPISIIVLPDEFSSNDWFSVYLYKKEFGELILDKLPNGKQFIDTIKSPVIEFIRTVVRDDESEVSRGRLWYEKQYYDDEGKLIHKSEHLNFWYNSLCKWIKKNLPKTELYIHSEKYNEHISSGIKELIQKGYEIC